MAQVVSYTTIISAAAKSGNLPVAEEWFQVDHGGGRLWLEAKKAKMLLALLAVAVAGDHLDICPFFVRGG